MSQKCSSATPPKREQLPKEQFNKNTAQVAIQRPKTSKTEVSIRPRTRRKTDHADHDGEVFDHLETPLAKPVTMEAFEGKRAMYCSVVFWGVPVVFETPRRRCFNKFLWVFGFLSFASMGEFGFFFKGGFF